MATSEVRPKPLKEKLLDESQLLSAVTQETHAVYRPHLDLVSGGNSNIRKYKIGQGGRALHSAAKEKVIMLVGATGSGKTTLINGLVNYIFGVGWEDSFRFKMVLEATESNQAHSQTSNITSYTLHHQKGFPVPYTLTIVDTPGFGDTKGIERDGEIIEQIRTFFSSKKGEGIDHIDAIGFVAKASENRLTPTQRYIFDQILSLFGKDIEKNIFLLATFADGPKLQLMDAITEANVPYQKILKFNNSALFVRPEGEDDSGLNFGPMFWKMGANSFKVFLEELKKVDSKSLTLTKEVLDERRSLETYVKGINDEIQVGLTTLERLSKEIEVVKKHEEEIDKNKEFTYEVQEEVFGKIKLPAGQIVTNCTVCKRTCHEDCWGINLEYVGKYFCSAMDWLGNCKVCPKNCSCQQHENSNYVYKFKLRTVQKTSEVLKMRYQEANEQKLSAEAIVDHIMDEYKAMQLNVLGMTESVRKSLKRLDEIALRPNPLSTSEYIDILVLAEENQAQPGWQARVRQLNSVKKEVETMQQIANKGLDPLSECKKKIEEEKKKSKSGFWKKVEKVLQHVKSVFT